MAQIDKVCMELAFNKQLGSSQRAKVKEFWAFMDSTNPLKPHGIKSRKKSSKVEHADHSAPKPHRRMWHDQLKVFQQRGLDKVALAAGEACKVCHAEVNYKSTEFADTVEQPYQDLLNDIEAFEERVTIKQKAIHN